MPERDRNVWHTLSERARTGLLIAMIYLVALVIAYAVITPEQYDIEAGDVAPTTITASRDVIDEATTQRRREAAAQAVSSVYYKDDSVAKEVLKDLEATFSEARSVRELGAQIREGWLEENLNYSDNDYQQAASLLGELSMSKYQLRTLMNTTEIDFETLYQSLLSATRTTLVSTINEGQIETAISNIQQIVAYNTRTDLWYNVGIPILRQCLRPNMLIDQQGTEMNREKAAGAIEPTIYKQGQNIVVKGDRITAEQIGVLESLGLIRGDRSYFVLYLSTAIMLALLILLMALPIWLFHLHEMLVMKNALVMSISVFLAVICSLVAYRVGYIGTMPTMVAAMLVVNLIGAKPAVLTNTFVSLFLAFLTFNGAKMLSADMLSVLFTSLMGGTLAIFLMKQNPSRSFAILTALAVGALNFTILLCISSVSSSNPMRQNLIGAAWAFVGTVISSMLCVGIQPVLESTFNLVTTAKLLELSNPNQPLLRRLMIEAPGTYHHSMIVANLAEAAADEIGANSLLVRVGAYYHDIGKLVRPQFFKENQVGENPHDQTEPQVSVAILTEHPRDGIEMAKRHHLPEQVVDMIEQHHGNTAVMYFYAKAVNDKGAENVNIDDFRYEGRKPQTSESAILMLADTVEAAVRSIQEPTRDKMRTMIRKLVRGKMEDGQLDECTLTFLDIGKICGAFETVLQGVYHERIEYPEIKRRAANGRNKRKSGRYESSSGDRR